MIEWVAFAFPISGVPTSDIGRDFPQALQVNAGTVPKIRLKTFLPHYFPIHYSLIILTSDDLW
jgi:hypothetical protein